MKLGELFERAVQAGIENDPRGREGVEAELERLRKEYEALGEREKQWFDKSRLTNPFADTRIHHGDPELELKRIAVGVDTDNSELLLVNELRRRGERIDALVGHHPAGWNMSFHHVLEVQVDMLEQWGVPVNQAEAIMEPRIAEVSRGVLPSNTRRVPRTAELLDVPFLSLHSVADVCVNRHVQRTIDEAEPRTVGDLIELLTDSYPEYLEARRMNEAMRIFAGKKDNRAGKTVVKFCGGTQGPVEQFEQLARAGVGTMVCMHLREDARKEAEKHHINVLVAGHMASDSIGLNLLLAEVDPGRELEILPLSGYIFHDRRGN